MARKTKQAPPAWLAGAVKALKAGERSLDLFTVPGAQFHPRCTQTFRLWKQGRVITSLSVGLLGGWWTRLDEAAAAVRFAAVIAGIEVELREAQPGLDVLALRRAAYLACGPFGYDEATIARVVAEWDARVRAAGKG